MFIWKIEALFFVLFIALIFSGYFSYNQQMPKINNDSSSAKNKKIKSMENPMSDKKEEVAHPFFLTWSYLRLLASFCHLSFGSSCHLSSCNNP